MNGVEVFREVGVDDFAGTAIGNAEVSSWQGHLRLDPSAKTILSREQGHFENRTDPQQNSHLHHPAPSERNPERPFSTIGLGYPDAQQGLGQYVLARILCNRI